MFIHFNTASSISNSIFVLLFILSCSFCIEYSRNAETWVIKTDPNLYKAQEIVNFHNFEIIKAIDLEDSGYYVVKSIHHRSKRSDKKKSMDDILKESESRLREHPNVLLFQREKISTRIKRDFTPNFNSHIQHHSLARNSRIQGFFGRNSNEDPQWENMWYLNRNMYNKDLPDMNVTGAWAQGYSGKGVSVTFLDDGLEYTHPDLKENYDRKASYDINNNDDDPIPRYEVTNENKHGTRCAGEVAAIANNSICSVGVAYNAGIGGIRMLDGDVTDSVEARSLVFNRDYINIYSASWGPDDNGQVVDGPGNLARKAFAEGVKIGRKGLGSVFVWASGNGGRFNDSCACDGYANSIYTLSISSTSESSEKPWYLEECTSTLATTYSSGDLRLGEREIATTDIRHKCTVSHTGTSASAPIAAAIIALALEANPKLSWRDIMYLIVFTSRPKAIKTNNYIKNKRGFLVSSRYGFGLMDAGKMVELAKNWENVPELNTCETSGGFTITKNRGDSYLDASIITNACFDTDKEVNYIEQVEIIVSISADVRGNIEVYLTSPMGTRSLILPRRLRDKSNNGFHRWAFMTVQLWGESPRGEWKLEVTTIDSSFVKLTEYELKIHGTKNKPTEYDKQIPAMRQITCNYECIQSGVSCGPSEFDCSACTHYSLDHENKSIKCVSYCPKGYFADNESSKCVKCHESCLECSGPSQKECLSCHSLKVLDATSKKCLSECHEGTFLNSKKECEPCSINCLTCNFNAHYCTSCDDVDPNTGEEYILNNSKCVLNNTCESNSFYKMETQSCKYCDITCSECYGETQNNCLACLEKRPYLKEGQCLAKCPKNHYVEGKVLGYHCVKCHENCAECDGSAFKCKKCKPGFMLNDDKECVLNLSEDCNEDCYECFEKDKCIACKNGFASSNGQCISKAPDGYYKKRLETKRGITFVIAKCKTTCLTCTDYDSCQTCQPGSHLIHKDCQLVCKPNFYSNSDGECIECDPDCNGCLNETKCLACHGNKKLLEGKCIDHCPLNYFTDEKNHCKNCYPSCQTCNGPEKSECFTCEEGYKYDKGECVSECAQGTFFDKFSKTCRLCNGDNCTQCIKTSEMCTHCSSPMVLDEKLFMCKPCCVRTVHGQTLNDQNCCTCASENIGFCSSNHSIKFNSGQIDLESLVINGKHNDNTVANNFIVFFSLFLIMLAISFITFSSLSFLKSFCKKTKNRHKGRVEYSQLTENIEFS